MAVAETSLHAPWLLPTLGQMLRLLDLEENWNSYGAPPISPGALGFALDFLMKAMREDTPAPSVVASPAGGLQFEWHEQGIDLEVEVLPGGLFDVYFADSQKSFEEERSDMAPHIAADFVASRLKSYLCPR